MMSSAHIEANMMFHRNQVPRDAFNKIAYFDTRTIVWNVMAYRVHMLFVNKCVLTFRSRRNAIQQSIYFCCAD